MSDTANSFTDGRAYERQMGRWSKLAGATFIEWLGASPGLAWLDVGCGNGAFTEELIARCAPRAVTGVDPSEGQLAYAQERPGAKAATFRLADAQDLPFEADSFDAATMALVIAFVPEPIRGVREMARVVRKGGLAATYMWDLLGGGVPNNPLFDAMRSLGIERALPPGAAASGMDAMRALWEEAGLRDIESREIRVRVHFDDLDDFWESTTRTGPPAKQLEVVPEATRAAIRERLRDHLPVGPDGRITYEARANAVKGRVG
jgi:SAM-dependent methyltransferase